MGNGLKAFITYNTQLNSCKLHNINSLKKNNNWIETEGSPFIIVEQKYANEWNCQEDYDSVCSVTDYLGKIYKNNHAILVMGDEPMAARIVNKDGAILIIRWMYAPSYSVVDKLLESDIIAGLEPIEEIEIEWDSTKLVLFDSLYRFCEAPIRILLSLQSKSSLIKTYHYKTDIVSLIIHSVE